mmetsp:Transcript_52851/g.67773  ORF Transcript_52851/g.67773 Transcript_52851/m.67773 type:complete len:499 (+) Transcript_52851:88-1584(+)
MASVQNQVSIIKRGEQLVTNDELSVLSWNVLANRYLQNYQVSSNPMYVHIPSTSEMLSWPTRSSLLISEMIESNADILCLQECEDSAFLQLFQPQLNNAGYDGLFQEQATSNKGEKFDIGVATFWKKNKLSLSSHCFRSRTMVTVLTQRIILPSTTQTSKQEASVSMTNEPIQRSIAILNCHLQGHPSLVTTRVKQLQNSLKEIMTNHSHHALLVVGDFNCPLQDSACSGYLAFGSVPNYQTEWGRPVPPDACEVPKHMYTQLQSAVPNDPDDFTFCTTPGGGHAARGLDQIWYSASCLDLVAMRSHFRSEEEKSNILNVTGMPCRVNPSDHVPIASVFKWKTDESLIYDLRTNNPTNPNNNSSDNSNENSSETMRNDAMSLILSCPITDEQRMAFEATLIPYASHQLTQSGDTNNSNNENNTSTSSKKGKPSKEEIDYYKNQRQQKELLLEEFSEEARQMLDAALKLRRKAEKFDLQKAKSDRKAQHEAKTKAADAI